MVIFHVSSYPDYDDVNRIGISMSRDSVMIPNHTSVIDHLLNPESH